MRIVANTSQNIRLVELDALRGLAAIAVVLYHYTTRISEIYPNYSYSGFKFPYGNLGVQLFFLLSGFVIFLTIKNKLSPIDFLKKRAIRLYPSYIICVMITYLLISTFGLVGREVSISHALINFSLMEGFIPGIKYVDGAYWSLTVEITFYIFIALLLYMGFMKYIFETLCLWLAASFTLFLLLEKTDYKLLEILYQKTISNYSYLFIAGISFYFLSQKFSWRYLALLLSTLIFQYMSSDFTTFIVVMILYLILWGAINQKLKFLSNSLFVFLGNISYSLYLIHQNIGYIILLELNKLGISSHYIIVIPLITSILISYLITIYCEKPMMKYLKTKFLKEKQLSKAS
ncbi:hypothetical protein AYO36_00920 [Exiguobacterium sp. KKBO11]|uniref:acyltransferase family protein n=1 Tax=Exiguobacterium sp. KKBO11 TaxID=1805000 RepID=UPI0007D8282C|nr:acyltransferase [Exiguobacterium sp. KKBO11]OAI88731.1 hypothetical protein AYO36_00920 [Exiguobacterium sp. KKBO11]